VVGSLEQGSAETSLLIVCFKAEGGKKSCAFPPMGPRVDGPAGPRRMGLQVTSELEGPTGPVGGARGSHQMCVLSEGVAALLTGQRKEMLPGRGGRRG
jgi:hypothetical protein